MALPGVEREWGQLQLLEICMWKRETRIVGNAQRVALELGQLCGEQLEAPTLNAASR